MVKSYSQLFLQRMLPFRCFHLIVWFSSKMSGIVCYAIIKRKSNWKRQMMSVFLNNPVFSEDECNQEQWLLCQLMQCAPRYFPLLRRKSGAYRSVNFQEIFQCTNNGLSTPRKKTKPFLKLMEAETKKSQTTARLSLARLCRAQGQNMLQIMVRLRRAIC